MGDLWDWSLRLVLAAGLGALIGGERESHGHPAGIRTQSLVALAASLLTTVGQAGFFGPAVDFSRVASQVVTGIGFIGAGVILKHRGTVTGLTTAATLFLSAGVGVATGAGLFAAALITTAIAMVVTYGLKAVKPVVRRNVSHTLSVDYIQGHGTFGPLVNAVQEAGGSIQDLRVDDETTPGGRTIRHLTLRVHSRKGTDWNEELHGLLTRPEVERIRVVEG